MLILLLLFSHPDMSSSLWPYGQQDSRLACPSLSPGACSNSCPLNRWCHPTILSSATRFFSCPQAFRASGSFPMSWLFISDGQSIGALASVFPMNIQGWFPLGWTDCVSLQSKGLSRVFSNTTVQNHWFFNASVLYGPTLTSNVTTGKTIALTRRTFVSKVMSLFFNMLSGFIPGFLPRR